MAFRTVEDAAQYKCTNLSRKVARQAVDRPILQRETASQLIRALALRKQEQLRLVSCKVG